MSPDSVPEPTAPEAASRIGSILAAAERQVAEILAQADRQAADVHAESARRLQERSDELEEIARNLAAAAATAQAQLDRLRGLEPVDLPGGGTAGGAVAAPATGDAPSSPARPAVGQHGASPTGTPAALAGRGGAFPGDPAPAAAGSPLRAVDRVATDGVGAGRDVGAVDGGNATSGGVNAVGGGDAPVGDEPGRADAPPLHVAPPAHPFEGPTSTTDDAPGGGPGAGILHRPDDWVGGADAPVRDADADAPRGPRPQPTALDDMPIIAQSDGADYPSDPPEKVDSARLVALSMAANGRSREEVEAHVRDELGIKDHASLIDYVFGINAPSSIVPSWPPRRRRRP